MTIFLKPSCKNIRKRRFSLFLLILLIAIPTFLFLICGCTRTQKLNIPEMLEKTAIGNKDTDLFFDKKETEKLGIKGRFLASVLVKGIPQIVLFDINTQKISILTESDSWNRAPEFISNSKIVFCTGKSGTSQLILYDLKTGKETTLTGIDANRYDPESTTEDKIVYNVFPKTNQFFLAVRDLNSSVETTLTLSSKNHPGKNLALRSAEPAYDKRNNVLYFVTDLAFEGKPKPLNIWKANLGTKRAEQLTANDIAKVWEINGSKITSPQYYDLKSAESRNLLYCLRFIEKPSSEEQPRIIKSEVHIISLDKRKDEVLYRSSNLLRSPVLVTNKYLLLSDPDRREIILVNVRNKKDVKTFVSNIDIVGDVDFVKD